MNKVFANNLYESIMTNITQNLQNDLADMLNGDNMLTESKKPAKNKFKWIEFNKDNFMTYRLQSDILAEMHINKNHTGWMVINGEKLAAYCIKKDNKIVALETQPEFRNQKWATKLIKKAKENGCNEVYITKNDRPAIGLYFKNGFYICGSNKTQLRMKLREPKNK